MNRSTAAASVLGLCIAGGVGGYLAGQQAPQESNASGPATTSAVAPTAVATPRATSSVSAQSDAAPPGAGVAGSSTAATDAASPGVVAPPPAEVTDANPDGTRTGTPAAPNKGDRPQQAPETTKRSSGGEPSNRPPGRQQTEATPRPSQKRTAAPNPPGDAQATWNSLSQAERDSLIARYQAMSPSEKKAARAAVCAQYGVGC